LLETLVAAFCDTMTQEINYLFVFICVLKFAVQNLSQFRFSSRTGARNTAAGTTATIATVVATFFMTALLWSFT